MDLNASPTRDIRNSNYNYVSNTSQHYEEQFWKLKAQKASVTIEELKTENQALNKRLIEMSRIQQELREKIIYYEDDWKSRSRRLTTERISERLSQAYVEDKLTPTHQLQRLYKEIRIIKNTHELEMTKLKEENKKLKKQIEQNKSLAAKVKVAEEKLKQTTQISNEMPQLKKKIVMVQDNLARLRDEKARLMAQNDKLRKEIQDIRVKEKVYQKEEEQKLIDYKKRLEELNDHRVNSKISDLNQIIQEPKLEQQQIPIFSQRDNESNTPQNEARQKLQSQLQQARVQVQTLKRQILLLQKKQADYQSKLTFERENLENEQFSNQIRIKKLEGDLIEAKTELSDVLRKLSPLLEKRALEPSKQNAECKAGLSILQIFLQKYKIQAF